MKLSANEAARQTGKSVPTITRAIKSGKISAEKTSSGGYLIEASELFRVFKSITKHNTETHNILHSETPQSYPSETISLREKIDVLEAALQDAKAERDEWRDQAKRLAMALPSPDAAKPVTSEQKQGFWRKFFK